MEPRLFLRDVPAAFAAHRQDAPFPLKVDALMEDAERRRQLGRNLYLGEDIAGARREFDAAVDLMLEASSHPMRYRQAFDQRFERMVDSIHRLDLKGMGADAIADGPAPFEKAPLEDILEMTFPVDPRLKTRVLEQVRATASQLPLSMNDAVLGYIHYFMGRGHRTLLAGFERAGRYRPMIRRILDEEGVPQELIYLAQAESGFLPRAVSRKAATGMWQFMAFRGREYGLERTPLNDDRLDPEKATRAAARHLRDLYHQFGDWYLAIAAYNCGPVAVEKAVERTGYADFWELRGRRVLPAETTNYVPIILAMTIMAKNAGEYGLDNIEPDAPMEYDTVEMSAPTHLALVSDLTDAPLAELTALNPALLTARTPENYTLHVPKGAADSLVTALALIPPERRDCWRIHKVEGGETLAAIGKRYGATPGSILALNPLAKDGPAAGDRLVIPAARAALKGIAKTARHAPVRRAHASAGKPSGRATARKSASRAALRRGPASASNHAPATGGSN